MSLVVDAPKVLRDPCDSSFDVQAGQGHIQRHHDTLPRALPT